MKTIHILLNGETKEIPLINKDDFIIAVDGGIKHTPFYPVDVWIGDFDSSDFDKSKAKKLIPFPREKDSTDWELVLQYINHNFSQDTHLSIVGAIGSEYDHLLANFLVLANYAFNATIHTTTQKIIYFSAPFSMEFNTEINSNFSLLPFTDINELSSKGLYWELNNHTIKTFSALACRNKTQLPKVFIQIGKGKGLIFLPKESTIKIKPDC